MTQNDEPICQEALALLRQEVPLSAGFSQQAYAGTRTKIENACLRAFDYTRRALLAEHHWSFARKSAAFGTGAKPTDCVRIRRVLDADGERVSWRVSSEGIAADTEAATVVYTADLDNASSWPPLARAALAAALAREMCIPVSGRAEDFKAMEALAAERFAKARIADLNEDGSGSPLVREVKDVLKGRYRLTDADLDESSDSLAERIEDMEPSARREVMSAHRWNFARVSAPVHAAIGPDGVALVPRPFDCVRVEAVKTARGDLASWSMQGGMIASRDPVVSITYIRYVPNVEEWPPHVRRCLVYRLAAHAALTVPARDKDPSALAALYAAALSEAAVQDAREGNRGRDAWGHSGYVDAMRGYPPTRSRKKW